MDKKPFHVQVHTAYSGKRYGKTYSQQLAMIKAALGANAEKLVIEVIDYAELDKLKEENAAFREALEYYSRFATLPEDVSLQERIGGGKAHEVLQKFPKKVE